MRCVAFTFAYANCTFDCVIRPTRQMCRPLGELSTSDLWRLIRQRQRQKGSDNGKGNGDGKDHAVDVCAATTTETTSVASLPFRFQCSECFGARVLRSNFPPDDSRHASPHSLSGKLHKYLEELPYQRGSLIRAERTFARINWNIHTYTNTHSHTLTCIHLR